MTAIARKPIEERADVEALEQLHHERRTLLDRLAPLKALHGAFGLWDDKRSQFLEAMRVKARREMAEQNIKATDESVKARAAADPEYVALLDRGERDRIEYLKLANSLSELEERIRSREYELAAYAAETRLGR